MASPQGPSGPGPTLEDSNVSDYLEVKECIQSMVSWVCSANILQNVNLTSMPELVAKSKEEILNVKSMNSKKRTLDTMSSTTLDQGLTSKDTACKPFWNESCVGWSKKLWSSIKTGLQELPLTSWSTSSLKLARRSWFTVRMVAQMMTSQTISSPLLPTLLPAITDVALQKIEKGETKKSQPEPKKQKKSYEHPIRAKKIRIYPTNEQRTKLNVYFGSVRFCYNKLVGKYKTVGRGGVTLATLRAVVKESETENAWLKEIPCEIKDVAVRDFDKARKAHFSRLKKLRERDKNATLNAKFKFRTKRDPQQSIEVRARDMMRKNGHFSCINLRELRTSERLPENVEHSVRFIRDRLGHYFLVIPVQVMKKSENQTISSTKRESIVSLDPGVRTFQTTYDVSGVATEWGKGDMCNLFRLCRVADKLQSIWKKKKGSRRRSTKKAWFRVIDRIKNKVKEIHFKMAKWLCEEYTVILIPKFDTSRMVRRSKRKITSNTARNMLTWSHYLFQQRLKNKAELYPWVKVVVCNEAYTSKTCGQCGVVHSTLGGNKTFRCKECGYESDRDINAARNILLRYLSSN